MSPCAGSVLVPPRRRAAVVGLVALLVAAGCTTGSTSAPDNQSVPPPFAGCADLLQPPAAASPAPSATVVAAPTPDTLPDLQLECFNGGEQFSLSAVQGPAVINLWASWCPPCRKELPAFQRLSERLNGALHVVGVNVRDDRSAAQSLAEDFGLRFPNLIDPDDELRVALERPYLPITLFVDAQGTVRHIDMSGALDDAELADLVERHLGVVVPA